MNFRDLRLALRLHHATLVSLRFYDAEFWLARKSADRTNFLQLVDDPDLCLTMVPCHVHSVSSILKIRLAD